jgi:Na+-translocating ferredoxin:NAD+ oxidoreductase subunit B
MQTAGSETIYRKLQRHLDRMPIGFPATESGIELRILERLFTPEEAEIALELSAVPEPASVIHRRFGARLSLAGLRENLDRMAAKGSILSFPISGETHYGKMAFAIGMYERQVKTLTPEFERHSRQYFDEAFGAAFHTGKTPQLRVVPVNRRIAVEHAVTTYDSIRTFIENSPGPFGVLRCICRHGHDLLNEPCRQTELRENCLMIGPAAAWAAESGSGRAITRDEMLGLLDCADRDGLVLQPENTKSPMFVCCCCGCCCGVLNSARKLPVPAAVFRTNFYAVSDPDKCDACGTCEIRCQMNAIDMTEGKARVDRNRCIGCSLCVDTCPSEAMRFEAVEHPQEPPEDSRALYLRMFEDRYGRWGMLKLGVRKVLGLKI